MQHRLAARAGRVGPPGALGARGRLTLLGPASHIELSPQPRPLRGQTVPFDRETVTTLSSSRNEAHSARATLSSSRWDRRPARGPRRSVSEVMAAAGRPAPPEPSSHHHQNYTPVMPGWWTDASRAPAQYVRGWRTRPVGAGPGPPPRGRPAHHQLVGLAGDLDLAEEIPEAVVEALTQWPAGGVPERSGPRAAHPARRKANDRLRRDTSHSQKLELAAACPSDPPGARRPDEHKPRADSVLVQHQGRVTPGRAPPG